MLVHKNWPNSPESRLSFGLITPLPTMESKNDHTESASAHSTSHIPGDVPQAEPAIHVPRPSRESQSRFVEHISREPRAEGPAPPRSSDGDFVQIGLHEEDATSPSRSAKVKAKMKKIMRAPKKVTDRIRSPSGMSAQKNADLEAQARARRPRASGQQVFKVVQIAQILVVFLTFILVIAVVAKQDSRPAESSPKEPKVPQTTAPAKPDVPTVQDPSVPPAQDPSSSGPVVTDPQANPIFGGSNPEVITNPAIRPSNDVPDPMDPTNPNPTLPPVRRPVTRGAFYADVANHEVNVPSPASPRAEPEIPVFVDVGDLELPVP